MTSPQNKSIQNMKTLAVVVAFAFAPLAFAQTQTVEAVGEAAIVGNDASARLKATDEAKRTAQRNAVEQVAGVLVGGDTTVSNSAVVQDKIYSHSEGYIKKYELVGEPKVESGVVTVKIKAEVATKDLDKDLQAVKALVSRYGNRKLVIVIQEQTVSPTDQVVASGVMAQVLTDGFKKDGWTIIDPSFAAGELNVTSGASKLGATDVKRIGTLSKTDYIVYGRVTYRQQPGDKMFGGSNIFLVTGEYDINVFATDSGSQITTVSGKIGFNAKEDKISPTLSYERTAHDLTKKRGEEILAGVRKSVVDYLSSGQQNGQRLAATVLGLSEYTAVQNFKKTISSQVTGVREVRPGSFGNGKADFDILFLGTSDEFAEAIGGKKFQGKNINVTGVTGNTVELTLAK